jgi:3',5'-cyclic AMP phosphodiesterase CpdA
VLSALGVVWIRSATSDLRRRDGKPFIRIVISLRYEVSFHQRCLREAADMIADDDGNDLQLSRRRLLTAAGICGGATTAASLLPFRSVQATPASGTVVDPVAASPVAGLHLQFGADASAEVVVSWHTLQPVQNPRVLLGGLHGSLERTVAAKPVSYTDAKSKQTVYAYHAKVDGLKPDSAFLYSALHDGAEPEFGTFRTSPRGRMAFTFTSFGDQGTPTLGKRFVLPPTLTMANPPVYVNDNLGSPAAGDTTLGVERLKPLFHLFNGDLCYANISEDRVRTWWDFWENNSRSARNRPWMPSPGNHENELGNGPIGYQAYQTYFSVPKAAKQTDVTRGLWYAFTAGAVRVVSIANDDVCYQDGGDSYVRGYSAGAQKAWLEKELASARADHSIDWVVVCMHQVAISTVDRFNGADLGIREEWLPLFDKYEVDLVVCGHEHHYERSHPIRGRESNQTLTHPHRDGDRRHRFDQRHRAYGDRRRWNLLAVEPALLQSAPMQGGHHCRRSRPDDGKARTGLCEGAGTLVSRAECRAFVRLCRFHRRSGLPSRRLHHDQGHLLRCAGLERPDRPL